MITSIESKTLNLPAKRTNVRLSKISKLGLKMSTIEELCKMHLESVNNLSKRGFHHEL